MSYMCIPTAPSRNQRSIRLKTTRRMLFFVIESLEKDIRRTVSNHSSMLIQGVYVQMKPITFTGGGMLAALSTMLELMGHETTDVDIAFGMEAPYLFLRTEDGYRAGAGLYQPQWLNLYLHPLGFHLACETLPQKDVAPFLRKHSPALLRLRIQPNIVHPAVFSCYADSRYHFENVKPLSCDEPDRFSFSAPSLKLRLDETVTVYTLHPCPPENVDFLPLLRDSLSTLDAYQEDLLAIRKTALTHSEFQALRAPLFRALMQDCQPMATLIGDELLAESLRQLNHHYRHIITQNSRDMLYLDERLPKKLIQECIEWLKEDIRDRISELSGMEEDS